MYAIVPPYLLSRLADAEAPHLAVAAEAARQTLAVTRAYHATRANLEVSVEGDALVFEGSPAPDRVISDAERRERLPGVRVRGEDDPATGDTAADQAFDGLGETFAFLWDAFARASVDGADGTLAATVHYGEKYDNAFWNGERMVFGDGDGQIFGRFTASLEVIGHELTHGVTERTAALMRRMLTEVTREGGTGSHAAVSGYNVAGKTGTAEKIGPDGHYVKNANVSSFMGLLPAERPEIGIIVVLDNPQPLRTGGVTAGPVFAQIAAPVARYLDIRPVDANELVYYRQILAGAP